MAAVGEKIQNVAQNEVALKRLFAFIAESHQRQEDDIFAICQALRAHLDQHGERVLFVEVSYRSLWKCSNAFCIGIVTSSELQSIL